MGKTIGFIGLGAIGEGMAINLVKAGHTVNGHDVRPEPMERLVKVGGAAVKTPAQAARSADLLLITVFDFIQATEVLFGTEGAIAALPSGATVAMHTTMSPSETQTLAEQVKGNGYLFVDAPVTGGVGAARDGTMTIMASGSDKALPACDEAFRAISGKIARCGHVPGAATTVKMINQLMVGAQIALAAEAMTLAAKAGADPHIVYDVVGSGAARSFVWESRVPDMLEGDFSTRGVLDIFVKDLKIVLDGAARWYPSTRDSRTSGATTQPIKTSLDRAWRLPRDMAIKRIDEAAIDQNILASHIIGLW